MVSQTDPRVASAATDKIEPHASNGILNVLVHLESQGRKETIIIPNGKQLRYLTKHDLDNPNEVNDLITQQSWSNNYKGGMVDAYRHYARYYGLQW